MKRMLTLGSVAGFLVAVAGLVMLIEQQYFIPTNPVTAVIQGFSLLLILWARITFGRRSFHLSASATAGGLVTTGPYRWLRHPIYAAVIYLSWACLISHPEWYALLDVLLITAGLYLRMILEEKSLRKTYPEYAAYSQQAKRIIPFLF